MPLHSKVDEASADDELNVNPVYVRELKIRVPRNRIPEHGMLPDTALQAVRDELILDGNARLNLATFVTTWMEPQAQQLMAECFDKNMIDKDEYPQTAELERRCVNILAELWHAPGVRAGTGRHGARHRRRLLHHRLERGVHARRDGAAVALARAPGGCGSRRPPRRTWSWAPTCRSAGRSSAATGRSSPGWCRWSPAGCT